MFEIGFLHPDVFGKLGGHSAYFDPTNAPPANNPLNLAQTVTFSMGQIPDIWLDVGNDDADTRENLDVFAQTLRSRNVNFAYLIYPTGEHDAAYWQSHLDEYMAFYGQGWSHDSTELPTCK